jgi:Predicted protease with the C-terminal PDZ domain
MLNVRRELMKLHSRKVFLCVVALLLLLIANVNIIAQQKVFPSITYRLSMTRPVSHLFEVAIEVELPSDFNGESLAFQMPKWSPGRYAIFDFAKNVQEVRALSGVCPPKAQCKMAPRTVTRVDDQTWSVPTAGSSSLTFSYKVFGNDLSGTFSQLDERHANYNGGCIFMYVVDHKPDPVKLVIDAPGGWRIINGRTEQAGQTEWEFPNWDIMIDTPTEVAPDWTVDEFQVDAKKYHVMVHSFGAEGGKRPALVKDIEKIVRAETALWGPPEFDEYTFLIHFAADDESGDGMEHLTSTQIIEPGALGDSGVYDETLDTVAHEFFHVWNVKRLRPFELGPWDFTRPVSTRGLFVAEGFTNYYGHLMLRRAGLWDDARFLRRESGTITGIENAPGSRLMSAEESSLSAPFIDDAPHAQKTNLENTAISYYPKGELVAMVLDLLVRGRSNGKHSLDDVMRAMYEEFYLKSSNNSYYLHGRGYQPEDLQRVASQVAGVDFADFFKRHVQNPETLPYEEAFGYVGLRVNKTPQKEPFNAGLSMQFDNPRGPVIENVRNNSPAETAGLQSGDEVITVGGRSASKNTWLTTLARYKSGESIPITVKRNRRTIKANMVLTEPERLEYKIEEQGDATAEQKALRASWLSGG